VGGTNPWVQDWSTISKVRSESAAQKAASVAGTLGQPLSVGASSPSGVQSMTGASGGQMNSQDSNSFGQTMASLSQAIQGGDTGAAQDAFAKAKELLQSAGVHGHHHHHHAGAKPASAAGTTGVADPTDPFADAFTQVGAALKAGDIAGAQTAMDQLDTLLQGADRKLTSPAVGANSPVNPSGGSIDLTA
jgi:hypothetical protein